MNKQFRTKLVLGGALAVILAGAGILAMMTLPSPRTFVLRDDGWHPHEILIEPGETVTFLNHSSKPFWPASNNHPLHEAYTGFDAGHGISPGQSFTFTFDKTGRWGFHDHLRPFYTGYIDVGKDAVGYDCTEHLEGAPVGVKQSCWEEKLTETLNLKGVKAAFELFATFYRSDLDFTVVGCHSIAHRLGDGAYGKYLARGKDMSVLEFPPETVYCGYGYYHGILEHLIRDNPDFSAADAFCKRLIENYQSTIPRIRLNCYHAIGHGFIPEPTDAEMWGDPRALTTPAIAACKKLQEDDARQECFQGSFNVIADWTWNSQFGLRPDSEDPMALCRTFADREVSSACYYELSMRLSPLVDDDLVELYTRFVASIEDDSIAEMVIDSAAAAVGGKFIAGDDFLPYLAQCQALPERVRDGCIHGLSAAFIAHGEPEKEYVKAIAFCGNASLTLHEKDVCYGNIVRVFKTVYSREKVAEVCALIEKPYQHYCRYE